MDNPDLQKLKDYALRILTVRMRSEKELRMKLSSYVKKKNLPDSMIENVMEMCKRLEYVDDEKFVTWWVSQRRSTSVRGDRAIEQELRGKGISPETIRHHLHSEEGSELDAARILIRKKMRTLGSYPEEIRKTKLKNALLSRGFSFSVIDRIIDEMRETPYNTGTLEEIREHYGK
jgi:regulatory protein